MRQVLAGGANVASTRAAVAAPAVAPPVPDRGRQGPVRVSCRCSVPKGSRDRGGSRQSKRCPTWIRLRCPAQVPIARGGSDSRLKRRIASAKTDLVRCVLCLGRRELLTGGRRKLVDESLAGK
jgi:hypothetical protein